MFIDETDETDKFESSLPFRTPTQYMYINSGAIHVHSATGVLTVRGGKQLSLRGGGYIRGESIDKLKICRRQDQIRSGLGLLRRVFIQLKEVYL